MDTKTPGNIVSSPLYEMTFEHRPQYLYAFVTGSEDSYEISREYWQRIADECKENGYKKVLIEEEIAKNLSMPDMYRFSSEILNLGFFGIRIAFVDRYENQLELNQFGEIVATNRGLIGRVFNDFDEAEKWLLSE